MFFKAYLWRMRKAPYAEILAHLYHVLSLFLYNDKKGLAVFSARQCHGPRDLSGLQKKGEKSSYDLNEDLKWLFLKDLRSTFHPKF